MKRRNGLMFVQIAHGTHVPTAYIRWKSVSQLFMNTIDCDWAFDSVKMEYKFNGDKAM